MKYPETLKIYFNQSSKDITRRRYESLKRFLNDFKEIWVTKSECHRGSGITYSLCGMARFDRTLILKIKRKKNDK